MERSSEPLHTVYVATKNTGKLRELRAIFAPSGWRLETFEGYIDVAEGDKSYAANAALKAEALRRLLLANDISAPVLGDDSGLEVAALGGRPGVLSARYGGSSATWDSRRATLLADLAASGLADRSAIFVCALHYIDFAGQALSVQRQIAGAIAGREAGTAGFSYDSLFRYEPLSKTFAQLEESEKNRVSHRALAAAALLSALAEGPVARGKSDALLNQLDDGM